MQDTTLPFGLTAGAIVPLARPARRSLSRFGEYDVLAPLARGGMGGVYLAAHATTGARVALKVLDPQFAGNAALAARLHAEHALAARARHPGLLEIRAAAKTSDEVPYLVMEYLPGEPLGAISERGPIAIDSLVPLATRVASALAALHEGGVIHCDVKPDNIFVLDNAAELRDRRIKVIDFGVSRGIEEGPLEDDAIAGTPWCMAPEQWRGEPCAASDVYSLGCTLYDLATGAPPFDGSLPQLMQAHLEQRPSRPSWLCPMPLELERVILRALAKDPAHRPTMREVALELAAIDEMMAAPLRAAC